MSENTEPSLSKRQIYFPLLLVLLLGIGFVSGFGLRNFIPKFNNLSDTTSIGANASTVDEIIRFVESRYVDKISHEKLIDQTIQAVLANLDPHSTYISPNELQSVNEEMDGDFEGVGIEFMLIRDTINVVSTIYGGPSEKAGVLAGDQIISVNDSLVAGKDFGNVDITKRLRGAKGSIVKVGVKRSQTKSLLYFNIKRDEIPLNSIDAAIAIDDKTALIKINRFSGKTFEEFMGAVDSLFIEGKMENLILDLRQNPGGYLQEATNILSQIFEERNKLLVYTKGRNFKKTEYLTNGRSHFKIKKLAVLIDEGSASASEIVAGAIQDWDKGVIIGRRSFGKGLVQEQYDLQNGGALRLTVAKYYTPSGRCIQKSFKDYDDEIESRLKDGELSGKITNFHADSTEYFTSKRRVVYASGGISPDIFIPIDSTYLNENYYTLLRHASEFAIDEVKNNKAEYPKTLGEFINADKLKESIFLKFKNFIASKKLKKQYFENSRVNDKVASFLEARIARQVYGTNAFFLVQGKDDIAIQKALQQFKAPQLIPNLK